MPRFRDGGPSVLSIKRYLLMRPYRKLWIDDKAVSAIDIQARPSEKLTLSLGFNRYLATKDGMDDTIGFMY